MYAMLLYRFGPFELIPARFSLTREGVRIAVRPLIFDLLVHLVEQRERVVSRRELVETLWPDVSVGPTSLAAAVSAARAAIGDSGELQIYIENVYKRGYRFVAPVCERRRASDAGKEATFRSARGVSMMAPTEVRCRPHSTSHSKPWPRATD
jgi:DNA-binding winged helix-turn-helix (wHTH) protein